MDYINIIVYFTATGQLMVVFECGMDIPHLCKNLAGKEVYTMDVRSNISGIRRTFETRSMSGWLILLRTASRSTAQNL